MKIPQQIIVSTREYVNIITKVNLYVAKFGCGAVERYLDSLPFRMRKRDGKNLGAYIVSKVCQQYHITRYDLFESSMRRNVTEARQLMCVFAEKYLDMTKTEVSAMFNRSRHFAKRTITDFYERQELNLPFDQGMLKRFDTLNALIEAYIDFKPNSKEQEP